MQPSQHSGEGTKKAEFQTGAFVIYKTIYENVNPELTLSMGMMGKSHLFPRMVIEQRGRTGREQRRQDGGSAFLITTPSSAWLAFAEFFYTC